MIPSDESPVRGAKLTQVATRQAQVKARRGTLRRAALYFTGGNRITRFDSKSETHVFREPSGGANGLLFDRQGRLVACEAQQRRVTLTESNGAITVLADSFSGKKFNSPNDLSVDSHGTDLFHRPALRPARHDGDA